MNLTGCGCWAWSAATFGNVPGQSNWYEFPSKSPSAEKHPLILINDESDPGTQKPLSSSGSSPVP